MNKSRGYPQITPGRWAVQRERARIEDTRPPPVFREPTPVAEVIPRIMEKLGLKEHHWLTELQSAWVEVVGPAVAAHARPGRVEQNMLTVFVDNSAWLTELARFAQTDMLTALRERFGARRIREIRFQLDPEGAAPYSALRGNKRSTSGRS